MRSVDASRASARIRGTALAFRDAMHPDPGPAHAISPDGPKSPKPWPQRPDPSEPSPKSPPPGPPQRDPQPEPPRIDPPAEPLEPGDPPPQIDDPPAPDQPPNIIG
jgi:hypothetical protein